MADAIDTRFLLCPFREIIGCTITTCAYYCPDAKETYQIYLDKLQIRQQNDEKIYPFPQVRSTCPF